MLGLRLLFVVGFMGLAVQATAQPLDLILPTRNTALLYGDGPGFFQYTDRYFQGVRSRPWEGGQYGFVRNQKETSAGIVFTKFHEGMDIKPVDRDRYGEPMDTVWAIDVGRVVYANRAEHHSSYGKYVVVEHIWDGSPFYSLYAHLDEVWVRMGQGVAQGEHLGRLGYTGRGIDRRRAHVHFEINVMLNRQFEDWYRLHFRRSPNRHSIFNGMNLVGLDVASLYEALQEEPTLTIREFLTQQEIFYRVLMPNEGVLDLLYRYPWLAPAGYDPDATALEVSFTQSGLPVRVVPVYEAVDGPRISSSQPVPVAYDYITNGFLTGEADRAGFTRSGMRQLQLLALAPGVEPLPPVEPLAEALPAPEALPASAPQLVRAVSTQPGVRDAAPPAPPEPAEDSKSTRRRSVRGW